MPSKRPKPTANLSQHQQKRSLVPFVAFCSISLLSLVARGGAEEGRETPRRALPPKWSREMLDTFFPDAREQLQGERPDYAALTKEKGGGAERVEDAPSETPGFRWSALIRPETIEDEIKRSSLKMAEKVASPSDFKAGGYDVCRQQFSLAAVLFGVISEYDQRVRWRDEASAYRDLFARAGFNCKVGTDQTFKEAQLRAEDLQTIIRGSPIEAENTRSNVLWSDVADRGPLMKRLEVAHDERLTQWMATSAEFRANLDEIRHEAELLAVLAEVVSREGYEHSDDAQYATYAAQLRDAAKAISASAVDDYTRASEALDTATQSCADCHADFRD